jgi:hypothetical protein
MKEAIVGAALAVVWTVGVAIFVHRPAAAVEYVIEHRYSCPAAPYETHIPDVYEFHILGGGQ